MMDPWTQQQVTLRFPIMRGNATYFERRVEAAVSEGFAVHPETKATGEVVPTFWVVTHVASGALVTRAASAAAAFGVARALHESAVLPIEPDYAGMKKWAQDQPDSAQLVREIIDKTLAHFNPGEGPHSSRRSHS